MIETDVYPQFRYLGLKRKLDIVLCLAAMPVVLPILLLCAVAIRLDSAGPIVFRQTRVGRHGKHFKMLKFRTMVQNADELKEGLRHLSIVPWPDFKIVDDPRITRVGKILRKTSLDELPQLINVLRGDMSLVGPRPTDFLLDSYDLWQMERLEVLPGITGIWQVEGRHVSTFDERLRMDVAYLDTMSVTTDLLLLLRTVFVVFKGTGA